MYYGTTYAHSAGMSVVAILIVIAFIAAIIVAVLGYKKYVTGPDEARINIKDQATWGPFLRFDSLLIDKIVKALYLFNALFIAFAYVAVVIGSIYDGFGAFLGTLIFGFLALVVVELLVRVLHESIMLSVIVARNTSDIKRMMGGPQAGGDVLPPMPVAPQPGPAPYAPAPAPAPTYSDSPFPMSYGAPSTSPIAPVAPSHLRRPSRLLHPSRLLRLPHLRHPRPLSPPPPSSLPLSPRSLSLPKSLTRTWRSSRPSPRPHPSPSLRRLPPSFPRPSSRRSGPAPTAARSSPRRRTSASSAEPSSTSVTFSHVSGARLPYGGWALFHILWEEAACLTSTSSWSCP